MAQASTSQLESTRRPRKTGRTHQRRQEEGWSVEDGRPREVHGHHARRVGIAERPVEVLLAPLDAREERSRRVGLAIGALCAQRTRESVRLLARREEPLDRAIFAGRNRSQVPEWQQILSDS